MPLPQQVALQQSPSALPVFYGYNTYSQCHKLLIAYYNCSGMCRVVYVCYFIYVASRYNLPKVLDVCVVIQIFLYRPMSSYYLSSPFLFITHPPYSKLFPRLSFHICTDVCFRIVSLLLFILCMYSIEIMQFYQNQLYIRSIERSFSARLLCVQFYIQGTKAQRRSK